MYAILNDDRTVNQLCVDKYSIYDVVGFLYLKGKRNIHVVQLNKEVREGNVVCDADILKWFTEPIGV